MARKARVEVAGGLYHVIARGNNRRQIFNSPTDHEKFLSLLAIQKRRLPFFLYAYWLITGTKRGQACDLCDSCSAELSELHRRLDAKLIHV